MTLHAATPAFFRRVIAVPALLALVVGLGATPALGELPPPNAGGSDAPLPTTVELPPLPPEPAIPEISTKGPADSELRAIFDAWRNGEREIANVTDGMTRVEITHSTDTADLDERLASLGATNIDHPLDSLTTADLPVDALAQAESLPGVELMRAPDRTTIPGDGGNALAVSPASLLQAKRGRYGSDLISRVRVASWHKAGYTGKGVKIGIIDAFSSSAWKRGIASGDLRPYAGTFCRFDNSPCNIWGRQSTHGVSVAEAITDIAPGAKLYLADATTTEDYIAAIDYFASKGVRIISRSLGKTLDGPGNGRGVSGQILDYAVSKRMTWINSAGNYGVYAPAADPAFATKVYTGGYWRGTWQDADGDRWLDFVDPKGLYGPTEYLLTRCGTSIMGLRWNDWGPVSTDYDLYVYAARNNTWVLAGIGQNRQYLNQAMPPIEPTVDIQCGMTLDENGKQVPEWLAIQVWLYQSGDGEVGDTLELFTYGSMYHYVTNPGSAGQPFADTRNAGGLSVGAYNVTNRKVMDYSSRGPLNDGRVKPDLSGPSDYDSITDERGYFNGTSAAAPVVSGVAALILQRYPKLSAKKLGSYLRSYATRDRGAKGLDNDYGAGEIRMPLLNTKKPKISGKKTVGKKLKVRAGSWSEPGVKRSYRWLRNGKAIKGATSKTYKLRSADKGKRISVRETVRKSGYKSISITSAKTVKVKKKK